MSKSKLFRVAVSSTYSGKYTEQEIMNHFYLLRGLEDEELLKVFISDFAVVVTTYDGISCNRYFLQLDNLLFVEDPTHITNVYDNLEVF